MAVVSTNADLPRDTSISPLSDLPSITIPIPMDDVWKDIIVAGAATTATTPPPPPFPLPAEGSSSSNSLKGKRRALQEPLDKATLQKQRRMIKNRESAARSRERKQAYTSELECLVHQLEQDNARLLNEEAEMRRQRKKLLLEYIIPIDVMPKPKKKLRRVNSAQSL